MVVHPVQELPLSLPPVPRVVALGRFDGVHLGHRAVLTAASCLLRPAPYSDLLSVFTVTSPSKGESLCDRDGFLRCLEQAGADEWIEMDFSLAHTLSPAAFVTAFLRDTLHATAVVCGFNFRFGTDRQGDAALLTALCKQEHIAVHVVEAVTGEGEPISSSRIRHCLQEGDMPTANRLLGYPFTLRFPVVRGRQLGRTLGFPTINQPLPPSFVRPRFGVYASAVQVNGTVTFGVTNIGTHPTVGETEPIAETWIPSFSGDLYGQSVPVTPVCFLREERTFPSLEALTAQVKKDGEAARRAVMGETPIAASAPLFSSVQAVLFDFDDTLQNRHQAFEHYSRWLIDRYCSAWPAEQREATAQALINANNCGYQTDGTPLDYPLFFEQVARQIGTSLPAAALLRDYARLFPSFTQLFPDAIATVTALKKQGFLVGIITNGNAVIQSRKLDHSGLRPLLDVTVISGNEGVGKPNAEIFRRAAAFLGVAPARCLYVGDHLINDIQGATAAGMSAVCLDAYGTQTEVTVPRLSRPSDLLSYLTKR